MGTCQPPDSSPTFSHSRLPWGPNQEWSWGRKVEINLRANSHELWRNPTCGASESEVKCTSLPTA